jgi:DNA-binding transcriptional LysR family regulator
MDRLLSMTVFRRVAELQSFSAAARELRLSNAAVSKHVAVLEDRLRARLLQRTTRKVSLTAAGSAYLERCARLLDELDELEQAAGQSASAPKGVLRVNAPAAFGVLHLAPLLPGVLAAHPELSLEVSFTDRFVDLVEEGVDLVVRIATALPDSATQCLVATPGYLRRHGTPRTLAELARHECIVYGNAAAPWRFLVGGKPRALSVTGRLRVDNSLAVRDAVLAGVGIAMIPMFYVHELVRTNQLRVVLPRVARPPVWIHAVYPRQRHLSTKIRVFVEYLRTHLAAAPWAITRAGRDATA